MKTIDEYSKQTFNSKDLFTEEFMNLIQREIEPFSMMLMHYRCAIMEVETKFRVLNEQYSLRYDANPIESIKSRLKSHDSLIKKAKKKNIPLTLKSVEDNIHDIAGVRVVCSFIEDIYSLADCFLKQDDITLIERKDYIKNPKPNGYQSLHLIVEVPIFLENEKRSMKVEVQLRTIAMDFWASLEHKLKYKKDLSEEKIACIANELKECANESSMLDARMQKVRNMIRENE